MQPRKTLLSSHFPVKWCLLLELACARHCGLSVSCQPGVPWGKHIEVGGCSDRAQVVSQPTGQGQKAARRHLFVERRQDHTGCWPLLHSDERQDVALLTSYTPFPPTWDHIVLCPIPDTSIFSCELCVLIEALEVSLLKRPGLWLAEPLQEIWVPVDEDVSFIF